MNLQSISDHEVLSLLLGQKTAARLYQGHLLQLFATGAIARDTHPRLAAAKELVTRVLAEELKGNPAFHSPAAVRDYIRLVLLGKEYEVFLVLFLDAQNRLIEAEEMFRGTVTQTSVYPREVVRDALRLNASGVILAHNHPSGVAEPSRADEALTQTLKAALSLIDVRVLDHFVVAGSALVSLAERGLL
jgi:DNA repair protein RadC